jgi:DNA-binding transcriptional MerR regulator
MSLLRLYGASEVPFKASGHHKAYIMKYLSLGFTLKEVSQILDVNPSLVKAIDKQRLEFKFKDRAPEHYRLKRRVPA